LDLKREPCEIERQILPIDNKKCHSEKGFPIVFMELKASNARPLTGSARYKSQLRPMPRFCASRTISSATPRSRAAVPTDLKSVISPP